MSWAFLNIQKTLNLTKMTRTYTLDLLHVFDVYSAERESYTKIRRKEARKYFRVEMDEKLGEEWYSEGLLRMNGNWMGVVRGTR